METILRRSLLIRRLNGSFLVSPLMVKVVSLFGWGSGAIFNIRMGGKNSMITAEITTNLIIWRLIQRWKKFVRDSGNLFHQNGCRLLAGARVERVDIKLRR